MRSYHVAAAALAVGRPAKWIDNLLSHHSIPGVIGGRRGTARQISADAVARISIVSALCQASMGTAKAVDVTNALFDQNAPVGLTPDLRLSLDIGAHQVAVDRALASVSEYAVPARRGRPIAKRKDRGT
jgi:hypothetical protein